MDTSMTIYEILVKIDELNRIASYYVKSGEAKEALPYLEEAKNLCNSLARRFAKLGLDFQFVIDTTNVALTLLGKTT